MNLIPYEEIRPAQQFNFAPMIDFLFLMLSLFATLAISRATLLDSEINLVQLHSSQDLPLVTAKQDVQHIHISISPTGTYKWLTEFQEYPMQNIAEIQKELQHQYQLGVLGQDKEKIDILLHIDSKAHWDTIAQVIFGVKELGFNAHPVYDQQAGTEHAPQ